MNKAKAFNKKFTNVTYSTDKIYRHIDHTIKDLVTEEILLTTTQVRLTISYSKNNNSAGPAGINIRHLKHLGSLVIKYLTKMYNIAFNTNIILHFWKGVTTISILKPNKDYNISTNHPSILL